MIAPGEIRDWSVYKIESPTNRVYIGVTSNLGKRKSNYSRLDCKSQSILYNSFLKHGFSNHTFTIIDSFSSDTMYSQGKEMFWIRSFMSNCKKYPEQGGMNMTDGGNGQAGRITSDETKQKLRDANLGKKYSDETKKKLSEMRTGKKIKSGWTKEKRQKMREIKAANPHKHTEDAKKRIGEAAKGNKYSVGIKQTQERIEARSKVNRGNKYNLGRKASPSTLKKISENSKKPILQYSINGTLLNEFSSVQEASEKTGISMFVIRQSGKGRGTRLNIFYFKYK